MRLRRSLALGAAMMLAATAVVLCVRSLDTSGERTFRQPNGSSSREQQADPSDGTAPTAAMLAAPAESVDARTVLAKATCSLDVEVQSSCSRARPLEFELVPRGSDRGLELVDRERVQWRGLETGDYELRVGGVGWYEHRETIHLAGDPRRVVVALEPSRFVRGRVIERNGSASIRKFGLQIQTRRRTPEGQFEQFGDWIRDYESEDGQFCVGGAREHGTELRVLASADGFEDGETDWLPAQPTEGVSDVVVVLSRKADALATVAGVVVDAETSRAIENVDVVLVPSNFDVQMAWLLGDAMQIMELRMSEQLMRRPKQNRARSAADGTFAIETPRGSQGKLLAYHAEYALGVIPTVETTGTRAPLRIELVRGATLRGFVRTASEGEPFHVEQIEIEGAGSHAFASFSDDLRFEVHGLADGMYTVSVLGAQSDWRPKTFPRLLTRTHVAVAGQRVVEIEIPLGLGVTGGTVEGRVEAPDEPWDLPLLVGTTREYGTLDGEQARVVAEDGSFRITEVSPGSNWILTMRRTRDRSRWGVASARVDVEEGRTHGPIVLDMRSSRVAGTYGRAGRPARAAAIQLVTPLEETQSLRGLFARVLSIKTDDEGRFVVYGLPPGTYHFQSESGSRVATVEIVAEKSDYTIQIDDR